MVNEYTVKLFASLREHVGQDTWNYQGKEAEVTVNQLLSAFFETFPELNKLRDVTRLAVNNKFCQNDVSLHVADELAFIPPVSGG